MTMITNSSDDDDACWLMLSWIYARQVLSFWSIHINWHAGLTLRHTHPDVCSLLSLVSWFLVSVKGKSAFKIILI